MGTLNIIASHTYPSSDDCNMFLSKTTQTKSMIGFAEPITVSVLTTSQSYSLYACLLAWPLKTRAFHYNLISSKFCVGVKNKADPEIKHPFHKFCISKKRNWWSIHWHRHHRSLCLQLLLFPVITEPSGAWNWFSYRSN